MDEILDYGEVPGFFAHCFNTACPQSGQCLRLLAGRHVQPTHQVVQAVNPAVWPQEGGSCPQFKPIVRIRLAWGLRQAIGRIPYGDAKKLVSWLNRRFSRMTLSRIYNHKRPLSPDEQADVIRAFGAYGIAEEDAFDRVTYTYDWR